MVVTKIENSPHGRRCQALLKKKNPRKKNNINQNAKDEKEEKEV